MTENVCFICQQEFQKTDSVLKFETKNRKLVIHDECVELFRELTEYVLKIDQSSSIPEAGPDFTALPVIKKEEVSEFDAIIKLLQWASAHHPSKGLVPKEIDGFFREQYRWILSNASARLGELVEQGRVRRVREGKTFRYFA